MKYIFILSILIGTVSVMSAQVELERQVISPAGHLYEGNEFQISATMGESIVSTAISGSFVITQGFQQNLETGTTATEHLQKTSVDYKLFPNPTSDQIHVVLSTDQETNLVIRLSDLLGNQLGRRDFSNQKAMSTQFDVSRLPSGSYIVSITDGRGQAHISKQIQVIH